MEQRIAIEYQDDFLHQVDWGNGNIHKLANLVSLFNTVMAHNSN